MVEGQTIDDVGRALDRCADHNIELQWGLGRHSNDQMISFYCCTPDGAEAEFGYSGIRIEGCLEGDNLRDHGTEPVGAQAAGLAPERSGRPQHVADGASWDFRPIASSS